MASYNRVILMGNLTRDPELKYTPAGKALAKFGLAMNRSYKTATGETKDEVCFVTIVTWGKQAERCAEYLKKGSPALEGRLQSNSWTTPDGQKRSTLEAVADRVQFLRSSRGGEAPAREAAPEAAADSAPADPGPPDTGGGDDEVPF